MTRKESKTLKDLKYNMLNALFNTLRLPNLNEQDRQILFDTIKELLDERTPYDIRMRAFAKRSYIIEGITRKYSTVPNYNSYNKPVGAFDMFEDEDMPF